MDDVSTPSSSTGESKSSSSTVITTMPSPDVTTMEIREDLAPYFTKTECEEMTAHFLDCDTDHSGFIDEEELAVLFKKLDVIVSLEEKGKMIEEVDEDGNGLIDFDEFVMMMYKAKKGDPRFKALAHVAQSLNTTPVSILQDEAQKFGLKVIYKVLEERKATAFNPMLILIEVTVTGNFDKPTSNNLSNSSVSCEAIGKSTRDAKFKAAQAAMLKMKSLKPGMQYEFGTIPEDWKSWALENLEAGVSSVDIIQKLSIKGFAPGANEEFIQAFALRYSSTVVAKKAPKSTGTKLDNVWLQWTNTQISKGLRPSAVLAELSRRGFDPVKAPHFCQTLLKESDSKTKFDIWQAITDGELRVVKWYILGGFDINACKHDRHFKILYTPLQLAARYGHLKIVKFLLSHAADRDVISTVVESTNAFGRTALLIASRYGHTAVVDLLLNSGSSVLAADNFGNTSLHLAAMAGKVKTMECILNFQEREMRNCIHNVRPCFVGQESNTSAETEATSSGFRLMLRNIYTEMMSDRLPHREARHFPLTWLYDASVLAFSKLIKSPQVVLPKPSKAMITYITDRYYDSTDPECTYIKMNEGIIIDKILIIPNCISLQFLLEEAFRESFVNLTNRHGRTALHLAADANLVCSHEVVIESLVSKYGCVTEWKDASGVTPFEYLVTERHRPGSPTSTKRCEESLRQSRLEDREKLLAEEATRRAEASVAEWKKRLLDTGSSTTGVGMQETVKRSTLLRNLGGKWKEFLDSKSKNRFYQHEDTADQIQWEAPAFVAKDLKSNRRWALRRKLSLPVTKNGDWNVLRDRKSSRVFFYNEDNGEHQWHIPDIIQQGIDMKKAAQARGDESSDDSSDDEDEEEEEGKIKNTASLSKMTLSNVAEEDSEEEDEVLEADAANANELDQYDSISKYVRTLGEWEEREHNSFKCLFYVNVKTLEKFWAPPPEVLAEVRMRQAYAVMASRSIELESLGGWTKYHDFEFNCDFFVNDSTFEGQSAEDGTPPPAEFTAAKKLRDDVSYAERRERERLRLQLERARAKEERINHASPEVMTALDIERARRERELETLNHNILLKIREENSEHSLKYVNERLAQENLVLVKARNAGIFSSTAEKSSTDASARAIKFMKDQGASALNNNNDAANGCSPRSKQRRRVIRLLELSYERRMLARMKLCQWGCRLWFKFPSDDLKMHEESECQRRLMTCRLGCDTILEQYMWRRAYKGNKEKFMDYHEATSCSHRLVQCVQKCGVWYTLAGQENHLKNLCVLRPVPSMKCRLKCGEVFTGASNQLLEVETLRMNHEAEECPNRLITCNWDGGKCNKRILASEANTHRKNHLLSQGLVTIRCSGLHEYKVPPHVHHIKIQAWGAGGGSGHLRRLKSGAGGGGAFVEGIFNVHPGETLKLTIGSGGGAGVHGKMVESHDPNELMKDCAGQSDPGFPGGGIGYSGNRNWATGAGGGFTQIIRKTMHGDELVLIAGAGGGGGCRDGLGGGGITAPLENEDDEKDPMTGGMGSQTEGGSRGVSVEHAGNAFVAECGSSLTGGGGSEFGAGGGGGYYGGGGGGCAPGITGGGGGGSSFVKRECFRGEPVVIAADGRSPAAASQYFPPQAAGFADWDLKDGLAGEGGGASNAKVSAGKSGCVRIALPGFFSNMSHGCEKLEFNE